MGAAKEQNSTSSMTPPASPTANEKGFTPSEEGRKRDQQLDKHEQYIPVYFFVVFHN